MDTAIINALFQTQRLAYILIDQRLTIVDSSGAAAILDSFGPFDIGSSLVKRVPELVGSEPMVAALLAGATEPYRIEFVNRPAPDGGQRYLTLTMLPYAGARSDARLLVMLADTTGEGQTVQQLAQGRNELRLLREQLTQRNGELDAAIADLRRLDELKSMFVAIAAHELNNPLAPILGYIEMLLDQRGDPLTQEQREVLEGMSRSVMRLRKLTADLLDMARIEAGRIDLVLQPTVVRTLIEMVSAELRPQLHARRQALRLKLDDAVPPALCDESRAAQIIGNLLNNASRYTPPGGTLSVETSLSGNGFVQVAISDTGIGIAAEDQSNLFNTFFCTRSAVAVQASGTGLGLHIARLLVELHGGEIWLTSASGQGSTFYVTFPAAIDEMPET
ncbi:MAG: HAMP domain-containing histidine kinase [Kouleothrix sp.]|nr:HAMP domain-containing histidine kinase [Kouleothrix sp.]